MTVTATQTPNPELEVASVRDRLYGRYRSYQQAAASEDERRHRAPYLRRVIKQHFPSNRNARILDIGCGDGALLHFLREAGYGNVEGIDNSPEQLASAAQLGLQDVKSGDVLNHMRDAKSEAYDIVVAFDVIEHLTKPELLHLADQIYRTLSPGGLWLVHVPNAEGIFGTRIRYADLTHEQAFTRESINQLMRAVGFRTVDCFEDQPAIHGFKSMLRLAAWKVLRLAFRIVVMAETGDSGRKAIFSQNLLAVAQK